MNVSKLGADTTLVSSTFHTGIVLGKEQVFVEVHSAVGLDELPVITLPGRMNECWRWQVRMILALQLSCVQPCIGE